MTEPKLISLPPPPPTYARARAHTHTHTHTHVRTRVDSARLGRASRHGFLRCAKHQKSSVSAGNDRCCPSNSCCNSTTSPAPSTLRHVMENAGFGENLTFVLRLSPAAIGSDTTTNFALTQDNKQPPVQCYRRKPPSQIRIKGQEES